MAGLSKQKQKLLVMEKLFNERTDDAHPLTGNQLIDILAGQNIKCERKPIYDDVQTLSDAGMDIETIKSGHSNAYYLANRLFQDEELFVLADAVASSRFLTIKKSNELIGKLQTLTSEYKAKQLRRSIYVDNRSKAFNEAIYYSINSINDGITQDLDVEFKYFEYNADKKKQLKHSGEVYHVSPIYLTWHNSNYYLVCYCHKHKDICRYRVDRMSCVTVTDVKRRALSVDEETLAKQRRSVYNMYGGVEVSVKLEFVNDLMDVVIDRFGERVICTRNTDSTFYINVDVQISPTFWGWLFQFGQKAKILSPDFVVNMAKSEITKLDEMYK